MKQRCYNENNKDYHSYGGRGITICNEWLNNIEKFVEWSLNNGYKEGLQVDRRNNDKGYSPDNCRFVTAQINSCNRNLKDNISGFRGVYPKKNKFETIIRFKQKVILRKSGFNTAKQASNFRNKFIIKNKLPLKLEFNNGETIANV